VETTDALRGDAALVNFAIDEIMAVFWNAMVPVESSVRTAVGADSSCRGCTMILFVLVSKKRIPSPLGVSLLSCRALPGDKRSSEKL